MNAQPFLITSLPHSRTAWMSILCSTGPAFCRYETVSELEQIDDLYKFYRSERRFVGCSDCALGWFLPWIMENIGPRTVIIERDVNEVNAGLRRLGLPVTNWSHLLLERLRAFQRHPLVMWVPFDRLDSLITMRQVMTHLMPGEPFDEQRFDLLKGMKIEVDTEKTKRQVESRRANLAKILADVYPLIKPLEDESTLEELTEAES